MPSEAQWLTAVANLTNGSIVAADPKLYGASAWIKLEDDLAAWALDELTCATHQ